MSDPREQEVIDPPSALYALPQPAGDALERLAAQDALYALIQQYGATRVMTWVRNLAVIAGQEI